MKYLCFPLLFILITIGCNKTPTQLNLTAPQNLKLTIVQSGAGLRLDWDPVANATGYYVYFGDNPDSLLAICKVVNQHYYVHESSELDKVGTGYYRVLSVGGEYDSVVGDTSDPVRSAPYEVNDLMIYERSYNSGDSSAFGWDASGTARILSINDSINRWNIYCDDGDSANIVDTLFKFVTPQDSVGNNPPPNVSWDSTGIVLSSATYAPLQITEKIAPSSTTEGIKEENIFYLLIDNEYYAKIAVQSVSTNYVKFNAYFQPLKGFRRF